MLINPWSILALCTTCTFLCVHRLANRALLTSEKNYRDLFDNANDIIFTTDLDCNLTSLNHAGEKIFGLGLNEIIGKNLMGWLTPESRLRAGEMLENKMAGEARTIYEIEVDASGRLVTLEMSTRLTLKGGKPFGVQGIARDITKRKQLEAQLQQANKMEAVGRLAGGVAHDFNNLLGVISGYSDLLLEDLKEAPNHQGHVLQIKKATARAIAVTRQLLAFSRKQLMQPKVLDLNHGVRDIEAMLKQVIGNDIDLDLILDPALGQIKVDPGQMDQIVLNLVINARDAMPEGGRLVIATANVELDEMYASRHVPVQPGSYTMLAVKDTGIGMDAETAAKIFEPFFTTKGGHGTGLGLATVYGIVKQSGGFIWVYSEPGHGTTFKIYFPRVEEPFSALALKSGSNKAGGSETILLVEDDPAMRDIAKQFLTSYGYQILDAADCTAAFEFAEKFPGPIHLLLTDVIMPLMSGPELARKVSGARPGIRTLFTSGYSDDAISRHGVLEPGVAFLEKPYTRTGLTDKVRNVLDNDSIKSYEAQDIPV